MMMKSILFCLLALPLFSVSALAEDKVPADQAKAAAYFEAIITGDADKADTLIAVPFSLDRKSVLKTTDEVAAVHKKIALAKGVRSVPKYTIAKTDKAPELDAAVFPKYTAFRVNFEVNDKMNNIDIYVTAGEFVAVIGFSD
jgi:hypothetical protein